MTLIPIRICTPDLPFPLEDFIGRVKINSTWYPCGGWRSQLCPGPEGPLWGATCEIPDDRAIARGQLSNEHGVSPFSEPLFLPVPEPGVTSSLLIGIVLLWVLKRRKK